jgi:hypothetical protein
METRFMPKRERPVHAVTIDEHGNLTYLKTDANDIFLELGDVVTKRASHVEPATFWARVLFHLLRAVVSDKSAIAEWTRSWDVRWRVNTAPVGGPILTWAHVWGPVVGTNGIATWGYRQDAIDAEVAFLNDFFLTR